LNSRSNFLTKLNVAAKYFFSSKSATTTAGVDSKAGKDLDLKFSSLTAVSPIDGRYSQTTASLRPFFSEVKLNSFI